MADIVWPADIEPGEFSWGVKSNVLLAPSGYNGTVQRAEIPGSRFVCRMTLPDNVDAQGVQPEVEAFAAALRGMVNTAVFGHLKRKEPRGTMRGTPSTGGALRGALTMVVSGTGTLMNGDLIGVTTAAGSQLLMITAATGTNTVTVNFSPPLKGDVTAASAVVWNYPTTRWMANSEAIMVTYGAGVNPGLSIEFVEIG